MLEIITYIDIYAHTDLHKRLNTVLVINKHRRDGLLSLAAPNCYVIGLDW